MEGDNISHQTSKTSKSPCTLDVQGHDLSMSIKQQQKKARLLKRGSKTPNFKYAHQSIHDEGGWVGGSKLYWDEIRRKLF